MQPMTLAAPNPSLARRVLFTLAALSLVLVGWVNVAPQAQAVPSLSSGWAQPLDSMSGLSAGFLANNCGHPGYGGYISGKYHIANDYGRSAGTAVYSIGAGTVVAKQSGWPGSAVFVRHTAPDGTQFLSVYGHVNSSLAVNMTVASGQQIGTVYNDGGNSHLHFGIREATVPAGSNNGNMPCSSWPNTNGYRDPLPFLAAHPIGGGSGGGGSTIMPPDAYTDIALVHRVGGNGIDVHSAFGQPGIPFHNVAMTRSLSASDGWDWTKVKTSSGYFNPDGISDLLIAHQNATNGIDLHMLYGQQSGFTYPQTFVGQLAASDGWRWSDVKLESGKYDADGHSDLALLHKNIDGGVDVHVYAGGGTPFTSLTYVRTLPASAGWDWNKIKTASGHFNSDSYEDIVIARQLGDDGIEIHVLYGGVSPLSWADTLVRTLPASSGWRWSDVKLEAGKFNADGYSDIAVLHRLWDNGVNVHVLYGQPGTPFQNDTLSRTLPASAGWDWNKIKTASGHFNGDDYEDVAILHQLWNDGAHFHVLYGGATPFTWPETFARELPASNGWRWSDIGLQSY